MTKDEEIWLSAYCAGISADQPDSYCKLVAEEALKSFKARFPDTDEDLPDFLEEHTGKRKKIFKKRWALKRIKSCAEYLKIKQ